MFSTQKKVRIEKDARCSKCHKRIKPNENFMYINGKLYCEKCAKHKRDMDFLTFAMIMDDD